MNLQGFLLKVGLFLGALQMASGLAFAMIPPHQDGVEFDFSQVEKVESVHVIKQSDVAKVIPTDMQPTDRESTVATRILDRAVNSWLQSPEMQGNSLVKAANHVQKAMQTNVALGSTGNGENAIHHKVSFQIQAAQSSALLNYSGLMNASLLYKIPDQQWKFEISQKLDDNADLVIDRVANADEQADNISIRWTF